MRIVGVPLLLRELMLNLVDNGLRYAPEGGSVTLRIRARRRCRRASTSKTPGPGIPEAERSRVFDRFYRILGTNVDGSGLGLAIVREILERHEGLISIGTNPSSQGHRAAWNADHDRIRRRPGRGLARHARLIEARPVLRFDRALRATA